MQFDLLGDVLFDGTDIYDVEHFLETGEVGQALDPDEVRHLTDTFACFPKLTLHLNEMTVFAGGGVANGAMGFVAITEANDIVFYVAFFDSNPIDELSVEGDRVWARTSLGKTFSITMRNAAPRNSGLALRLLDA